jgi:RNA polymerase sigma factor (sigma-70 family)
MGTTRNIAIQDLAFAAQSNHHDHVVINRFMCELRPLVLHICRAVVGRYPTKHRSFDVDDLAQIVTEKVYDQLLSYDPKRGSVATWARRIAFRSWFDLIRNRCTAPIDDHEGLDPPSGNGPVDEQVNAHMSLRLVKSLMEPKSFMLLIQNAAGSSAKTLARETGVKVDTIKDRLKKCRSRARAMLGDVACAG